MWASFNFAAGPCIYSQAVILTKLTKFRLISSLEKLHSLFPAWERAFPREKRCLRPRNAGLQKCRAWERGSHAFPPTLIPDNSVHVQRTSAKKTSTIQNRQCQVRQKLQNCILNGAQLTSDDRAIDTTHWRMLYFCCLKTRWRNLTTYMFSCKVPVGRSECIWP